MRVTSEEVEAIQEYRNKVNSTPLEEIEFDFPVTREQIESWKFTGLSNWDFALFNGEYK